MGPDRLEERRREWAARHTLVGARVRIRPLMVADLDGYRAAVDEDEIRAWQGWTERSARSFVVGADRAARRRVGRRHPCPTELTVTLAGDDRYAGTFTITAKDFNARAELGWWLSEHARGQGYSAEALGLVLTYTHRHLGVPEVVIGTNEDNVRVMRQCAAAGCERIDDTDHRLPNGTTVVSAWLRHVDDEVAAAWRATHF